MTYKPIENYGIIGNLETCALVGLDGAIDFMCFPRFDAPSVFASILDRQHGGTFQITPVLKEVRHRQLYLPDTNVLLTRFLSKDGVTEVCDFMPVNVERYGRAIVRRVKTIRGESVLRMVCAPRFDYARADHRVDVEDCVALFVSHGDDQTALRLRSDVPFDIQGGKALAEFTLSVGETAAFVLEEAVPRRDSPSAAEHYVSEAFKDTVNYWRDWMSQMTYKGRWHSTVSRSALVLKLLTSRAHGSLIAAPTFSLPETIGGERNWDYRYTWIRDASFTLYAFIRLGFTGETAAFMHWIEDRCHDLNPDGSLQIMYGLDGRKQLSESILSHLEGYRQSAPVRIGNGAYDQLQLDIYGELMDSVYLYNKYGEPIHHDLWHNLVRLVDWVCNHWRRKDEGIWEIRGGRRAFLYSRLMCWVAVDRGIRLALKRSLPAPLARWMQVRDAIYGEIFEHFWHPGRRTFVQYKGASIVDASSLLMPLVKFISPTDPRWLSTLQAIESDLVDDSLVFRYKTDKTVSDGLSGQEGTFSICSFWYVECLARAGQLEKARFFFEKMVGYANHLGLYAEELGPSGEHLGNFPQAFTHLSLISAAYDLDRRL